MKAISGMHSAVGIGTLVGVRDLDLDLDSGVAMWGGGGEGCDLGLVLGDVRWAMWAWRFCAGGEGGKMVVDA